MGSATYKLFLLQPIYVAEENKCHKSSSSCPCFCHLPLSPAPPPRKRGWKGTSKETPAASHNPPLQNQRNRKTSSYFHHRPRSTASRSREQGITRLPSHQRRQQSYFPPPLPLFLPAFHNAVAPTATAAAQRPNEPKAERHAFPIPAPREREGRKPGDRAHGTGGSRTPPRRRAPSEAAEGSAAFRGAQLRRTAFPRRRLRARPPAASLGFDSPPEEPALGPGTRGRGGGTGRAGSGPHRGPGKAEGAPPAAPAGPQHSPLWERRRRPARRRRTAPPRASCAVPWPGEGACERERARGSGGRPALARR